MRANRLRLESFRNYEKQEIEFGPGINVIYGDNAQGKTNILEAVHMFSLGRSNRTVRDAELIRHGDDRASIGLEFSAYGRESVFEICLSRSSRKTITYNDIPVRKNSELLGKFNVVYFGPELLGLVKNGPGGRRRNMDMLISQLRPNYFSKFVELKRVVESKNALLKMQEPNRTLLDIMNEKLVALSAELITYRLEFIRRLERFAAETQKEISGGSEELSLKYMSCIGRLDIGGDLSRAELAERLRSRISAAEAREMEHRETIVSPHREDISYEINGRDARSFASQGQQKTIALVQKLAEVRLIKEEIDETPVLLLDDIMSELDKSRRRFVLANIDDMQIIITCTDYEEFLGSVGGERGVNRIYVRDGAAERQSD